MGTRVYVAGKMGFRKGREVLAERAEAVTHCLSYGLDPVDPAMNEKVPNDDSIVDTKMDYVTMKNFVAKDEYAIEHCDVLLVLTGDTPSDGTGFEMGLALYKVGIPVVMVAPKRCSGEIMGFANIKVSSLHPTIEDAVRFISQNYGGKNAPNR
jgi:nucleoside 2-deoxyribosyltransferase